MYKFINLMQSKKLLTLRNLGKYLQESFELRKSLINA